MTPEGTPERQPPRRHPLLEDLRAHGHKLVSITAAGLIWGAVMLVPAPGGLTPEGQQAIALILAAVVLFATEAIPLPAIGLLIPVYQVLVGGFPVSQVTDWMMSNALLFLMGTLMIVAALSAQGLDKFIALFVLTRARTNVYAVTFAVALVSALLTGFMSDAAAALMVAPVLGILTILRQQTRRSLTNLAKLLIFAVGFGSIVGSVYTPAGGARNVIMMDYLHRLAGVDVTFAQWTLLTLPYTLVMVGVVSLVLPKIFPPEIEDLSPAVTSLQEEMEERPLFYGQYLTLAIFAATFVAWMLAGTQVGIGIIALAAATLFLVLGLVEWRTYQEEVDWGVLMIYIGAISLGGYTSETGAAAWTAHAALDVFTAWGIAEGTPLVAVVAVVTTAMTSAMSAGATTSVMGPLFLEMAELAGTSALAVGLGAAMASSFGFMLVVSTPSNAIIYATGYLTAGDFLRAGSIMMLLAYVAFLALVLLYWPLFMVI